MNYSNNFTKFAAAISAATLMAGTMSGASAHTRFEVSSIEEGNRVYNNMVIGHGCGTNDVIGTSVVVPDGQSSSITVDGLAHDGELTDFVSNWGPNLQGVYSTATFPQMNGKEDSLGNAVGFWSGGANLPHSLVGLVPFRVNATNIVSTSCAVSVTFYVSIADICAVTGTAGLTDTNSVQLWTHNNLGTAFDRVSDTDNGPAPLTITRDLENNPLPPSCGAGVEVQVRPSAAQINRDMPIVVDGVQAWPAE